MSDPDNTRLADLVTQMNDEHVQLGPLDRTDISLALVELIGWRTGEPPAPRVRTETVSGD